MSRINSTDIAAALSRIDLFAPCTPKEIAKVAALCSSRHAVAGEVVVRQGDAGTDCYLIVDGSVAVEIDGVLVATLRAGELFGELASLDAGRRSATITVLSDSELLVLDSASLNTAVATIPGLTQRLLARMSTRIRATNVATAAN